ncbi:MAG: hypothetical protein K5696_05210 [Lachnospiraceae bacterium]|nr:hypothetical protein [Lachnospiraceae bacterium]
MIADKEKLQLTLTSRLIEIYGPENGVKSSGVLVPAILRDFSGMIDKAGPGDTVSETYRTEDGKAEIVLKTVKRTAGCVVTADVKKR